ncbi:transporter substrate-binding domain-containing protein [Pseudooceanicola sp. CBS1P-1]|uniref:histidine kinase n=1 Tax=Pseudooceanicola albus TaxID=2692189 RepID=A0A6L7G7A1_9RHOB|nr:MULTISPECIES: transporter substrate-binding domain-containing protein [Pseudooceanicola]MBT9384357.1 transporter substrate-binding domain-containing protein [Pseudooceanicola endophyticus]MXN19905.1 transporter substrate-binding domain-containing protein [Pseudooceanicola albus]
MAEGRVRAAGAGAMWRLAMLLVTLTALLSGPLRAQDRPQLTLPWTPFPGLYDVRPDGSVSGFFAELARAVADRAGIDLVWRDYPSLQASYQALARGQVDMMAGVVRLPALGPEVLYSDPLAETAVYLFLRRDAPLSELPDTMQDRRIGMIQGTAGSGLAMLGGHNRVASFMTPAEAFGALLMGQVDGVVALHKAALDTLSRAGLEQDVRIAGEPLQLVSHYVALAPGRAALLPRINAAIAAMQADGTLQKLLVTWNMVRPAPVPPVLEVGVTDFPPYQVIGEDGSFSGYGVEALRDLAARAGLKLHFRQITSDAWAEGPNFGSYDVLPPLSVTVDRREKMDFTIPIQRSPYAIFTRAGEAAGIAGLADLRGHPVGVVARNAARTEAEARGDLELRVYDSAEAMLAGLLEGQVDAMLYPTVTMRALLEAQGRQGLVAEVPQPFFTFERAIGLRRGLGDIRERLDAVIPGYLSSEDYQALRTRWLSPPVFWTEARLRLAQILGAGLAGLVLLAFFLQALRARRRAERLAQSRRVVADRLGAVLDAARSAIFGLRGDGQVILANPGALTLLGRDPAPSFAWPPEVRFLDRSTMEPLPPQEDPVHRALGGEVLRGEPALLRCAPDDPMRFVNVSSSVVAGAGPQEISTVLVMDDVTEQEQTRQRAERSSRLDALGQLTGGVAHDFNNILATIDYAAQLAMDHTDETGARYLRTAAASVRRGAALTARLLTFAKRRAGEEKAHSVAVVLEEFRALATPLIEETITLEVIEPAGDLVVFCDLSQLENALLNLVLNSRDAILGTGQGGCIRVSVRQVRDLLEAGQSGQPPGGAHSRIEFSVSDDGPGMSAEVRARATDPFFTTKGERRGSGLGLSMVYGFAEQAAGRMSIYSVPGHGTTVRLYLPVAEDGAEAEEDSAPEPPKPGNRQRILLAEDEADLLGLTRDTLVRGGYHVVTAPSGDAALALLEAGTPVDLLLSDVVMPGRLDGFALSKAARGLRPGLPVVLMSGYTGPAHRPGQDSQAVVLQKPCTPGDLLRAIQAALPARRL